MTKINKYKLFEYAYNELREEEMIEIEEAISKQIEQKKLEDAKIAEFNKFLSDGDVEFSTSNYQGAIDLYNKAK